MRSSSELATHDRVAVEGKPVGACNGWARCDRNIIIRMGCSAGRDRRRLGRVLTTGRRDQRGADGPAPRVVVFCRRGSAALSRRVLTLSLKGVFSSGTPFNLKNTERQGVAGQDSLAGRLPAHPRHVRRSGDDQTRSTAPLPVHRRLVTAGEQAALALITHGHGSWAYTYV